MTQQELHNAIDALYDQIHNLDSSVANRDSEIVSLKGDIAVLAAKLKECEGEEPEPEPPTGPTPGPLRWESNFQSNTDGWDRALEEGTGTCRASNGLGISRIEANTRDESKRAEWQEAGTQAGGPIPHERWYSWEFMVPAATVFAPGNYSHIHQTKDSGPYSGGFDINKTTSGEFIEWRVTGGPLTGPNQHAYDKTHRLAPLVRDRWYAVLQHVLWHPQNGFVEAWLDNKQVLQRVNSPTATEMPNNAMKFRLGLYRGKASGATEVHYRKPRVYWP